MTDRVKIAGLVDLASSRAGGKCLAASDDFFAEKENLIKPDPPVFLPEKYTDRGKWMDGWESRRKREPGHDWCVIRLAAPARVKAVDIDTAHFLGNHPPFASIEAAHSPESDDLQKIDWRPLLPQSPLAAGSQNIFPVQSAQTVTHLRLNIFPDGGVARLRVYAEAQPDWTALASQKSIDLLAIANGGLPLLCSDMFFSPMENLIMPGKSSGMHDGWESRRRRTPGNDWVILRLGHPGVIEKFLVDTAFFKGNFPAACSIDGCYLPQAELFDFHQDRVTWTPILHRATLTADAQHHFNSAAPETMISHIRLNIFPCGGVSRLRAFGRPVFVDE